MSYSTKNLMVTSVVFTVTWNLIDYLFDVYVARGAYSFGISNIVTPLAMSLLFSYFDVAMIKRNS